MVPENHWSWSLFFPKQKPPLGTGAKVEEVEGVVSYLLRQRLSKKVPGLKKNFLKVHTLVFPVGGDGQPSNDLSYLNGLAPPL